jgi:hypothetical protein
MIQVPDRTPTADRAARRCFASTLALLLLGLAPLPHGWAGVRSWLDSARSPGLNQTDREATAGGYYEGLIGGGEGLDASRNDLAIRLMGKPVDWTRFHAANVTRSLPSDLLQFELRPEVRKTLFGRPFTTNEHGQRDHPHTVTKPPGTFRIALLGSSIDMGWGVDIDEIYIKRFERWLNEHAKRRGLSRRFEVVNFAVAAYSPVQRLETFRRKAIAFDPDLVIFSATMLDTRLTEIHLCDVIQDPGVIDLRYDFVRRAIIEAGIKPDDLTRDAHGKLARKETIKAKLQSQYWSVYDEVLGTLATDCRSAGIAVACVIIPRAGTADAPDARAASVARLVGIAAHHALPMFDLSNTFDAFDSSRIEITPWDDHPNALGHERLFLGLARGLIRNRAMYDLLFATNESSPIPESGSESGRADARPHVDPAKSGPAGADPGSDVPPRTSSEVRKPPGKLSPQERLEILTQSAQSKANVNSE